MRTRSLILVLAILLTAPTARADLVDLFTHWREVSTNTASETYDEFGNPIEIIEDFDIDIADDVHLFATGIGSRATTSEAVGDIGCYQTSSIESDRLLAYGGFGGSAESYGESSAASDGYSTYNVTFDLTEATTWVLSGSIDAYDNGGTTCRLDGPSGSITQFSASGGEVVTYDSGMLPAGRYTFVVETSGACFGSYGTSETAYGFFDVQLLFGAPTGVPSIAAAADRVVVSPNPFRGATRISMGAAPLSGARADVFDVSGRLVRTLVGNPEQGELPWDGRDTSGSIVPAGAYFVRVATETGTSTVKVTALR